MHVCIHVCMHKHECVCVLCVHMSALLHVSVGVHAPKLYVYQAKNDSVCQSSTPTLYESHLGCFLLCMLDQLAHEIMGFFCLYLPSHPRIIENYYCVWLLHGLEIWTYVLKCSNAQCLLSWRGYWHEMSFQVLQRYSKLYFYVYLLKYCQ